LHLRLEREHLVHALFGRVQQQVDADRLRGELARPLHVRRNFVGRHEGRAEDAEPSRVRDARDQRTARRAAAHSCRGNGVLDAEQLREPRLEHASVSHPARIAW
jgi:hypothetical protein